MRTPMRVAAAQLRLHPRNSAKAVTEAEAQVRAAAAKGATLVCLPEHWLLSKVITEHDEVLQRFSDLAKELGVYLNLGAIYERRGNVTRLTSHTISSSGRVISRQDKVHLYRRETKDAQPGSGFNLAEIEGVKVGVLVCHDAVFPETARIVTLMGAELLVVPSLITEEGSEPWLVYLKARALENRVPIISPNDFYPPKVLGKSCVLDLKYDGKEHIMHLVERTARSQSTTLVVELELRANSVPRRERLEELLRSGAIGTLYSASKSPN